MKKNFDVTGMTCSACSNRVEKAVSHVPGVEDVNVNLLKNSMTVDYDETKTGLEQIIQADYRMVSDVRCIYVETAEDDWGYVQRYWVSVDTGLLVVAERLQKGETVYRMAALEADQTAPPAETFTLPDGTDLLHR